MPLITFKCRLGSPLHTAAERYSNVQTCAPYILGSTLRGAMLGQIIRRKCPPEHFERLMANNPGYHAECPGPCGAKSLFDFALTRFSFGRFPHDDPPRAFRSRVAIDRARGSVAEGALLQFEVITPTDSKSNPVCFTFEVETADESLNGLIREAMAWAGEAGIGAFRNQGFGRFVVEDVSMSATPPAEKAMSPDDKYLLTADTPYVLPAGQSFDEAFRSDLDRLLGSEWSEHHLGEVKVQEANLGYVGRWRYEGEKPGRETRAVALPGSTLLIEVTSEIPAEQTSRMLRGIGDWAEVGFGRFLRSQYPTP